MFKLKLLKLYYKLSYDLLPSYFQTYRLVIERESTRDLRQHCIHPPLIRMVYAECSPLIQLIKLINIFKADKYDTILEKIKAKSHNYYGFLSISPRFAWMHMTQFVELTHVISVIVNN